MFIKESMIQLVIYETNLDGGKSVKPHVQSVTYPNCGDADHVLSRWAIVESWKAPAFG